MARIQISQLESTVTMNRTDWNAGVAQVDRDTHRLSGEMDNLSAKSSNIFSGFTSGNAGDFSRGILQSVAGISLIAGGAAAAGAAVAHLATGLATVGVGGNAQLEQYSTSFKVLLGSADAAQKRIAELYTFAQTTPFELPEVVAADRLLQTFGGTVLATGKNLTLVGDIAAGTTQPFQDVAMWIGRTYDALQSGRPWGEAAQRLQEMGALSGQARARLEEMTASGASGAQVWAAFTQEMSRFNGMMQEQSHTFSGLASTARDVFGNALRTALEPVFTRIRSALEGLTSQDAQDKILGVADSIAKIAGAAGSAVSAVTDLAGAIGRIPAVGGIVGGVGGFLGRILESGGTFAEAGGSAIGNLIGANGQSAEDVAGKVDETLRRIWDMPARYAKQAADSIENSFTEAGVVVSQTGEGAAIVWVNAAEDAERAAEKAANAWTTQLPNALKQLKQELDAAIPDSGSNIQQLLDLSATAVSRAQDMANRGATGTSAAIGKLSGDLEEGVRVLNTWAQGNLDACSEAAGKWGNTAPEIIQHILDVRNELQKAIGDANAFGTATKDALDRAADFRAEERAVDAEAKGQVVEGNEAANPLSYGAGAIDRAAEKAKADKAEADRKIKEAQDVYKRTPQGQLDTAAENARTQKAIENLKANSKQYIDAAVSAEKAQRDARDKLEKAEKAAGLIDQTTLEKAAADAYKRTAAGQIDTAVQDAKTQSEISRMKATNKAYIDAVVQGQLDANKARDALEMAQKAAGLIEETTLEKEAKKKQSEVVDMLQSSLSFFTQVQELKTDVRGNVDLLLNTLDYTLKRVTTRTAAWKASATDEVKHIADNVKSVFEAVSAALNPMSLVEAASEVQPYMIDAAFSNVEYLLDKMGKLANDPRLQGGALQKLVDLSAAIKYSYAGIGGAFDTINSIGQTQNAVDEGTLQYGIGDLYNGLANAGNAASSFGGGGGGMGATYTNCLIVNGQIVADNDPDVAALIKKIAGHTSLTQGGVAVGA